MQMQDLQRGKFMRAIILLLLFTFVFGFSQIAEAKSDQDVKLHVNKQKSINKNDLTVKFVSVLEDSRCPEGTNCIWAGNAKIQIKLKKKNGAWKTFELNTNLDKRELTFGGYSIKIAELTPKSNSNSKTDSNSCYVILSISKV